MKRICVFIIIIILSYSNSNSQMLSYFKVKEGLEAAKQLARDNGASNPKMIAAFTSIGTANLNGSTINLNFDIQTGTANMWAYIFDDADNPGNYLAYSLVYINMISDFYSQSLNVQDLLNAGFLLDLTQYFSDDEWINSDVVAEIFRTDTELMEFLAAYPNPDKFILGLFHNTYYDFIPTNEKYWSIRVVAGEWVKICSINAYTSVLNCQEVTTGVDEKITDNDVIAYPNPCEESVNIKFYVDGNKRVRLSIIDNLGKEIKEIENSVLDAGEKVYNISSEGLSAGIYFYKLQIGNDVKIDKIILK